MIVFLLATVGLTLAVAGAGRALMRRFSGSPITVSLILLSALYFLVVFQLARHLIEGAR
ncbi:hypothetical protein ThidrDRAFT_4321 [Thiorhodococcus drewsii AZ1]|uniref:Uncharacterized protein n=1 Tax=Thiorhodococcus drewsii AZ1 TaxID=765913 RepID=G2E7Q8_9GAMM|nr:hypothetical protein [Thiorhodococcus drewsii]EGV27856.1 hypothetical protein ThidrDRAFT_4321 [Thiorhodococcus drewsii AZ1]